jgi:hypothetical protein
MKKLLIMVTIFMMMTSSLILNASEEPSKRDELTTKYLEFVATYAPDMLEQYKTAVAAHDLLHQAFLKERTAIYTHFTTETTTQLQILKADIDAKLVAKEITIREARTLTKTFFADRKAELKEKNEAYKNAIADEKTKQEVRRREVNTIRVELKAAIEAQDFDVIDASIDTLYTYLLEHIAFDEFRLATLQSIF